MLIITHSKVSATEYPLRPQSVSTFSTSTSSSLAESSSGLLPLDKAHVVIDDGPLAITKRMAEYDSGLDVRDRMWLKIAIPNAFLGKSNLIPSLIFHLVPRF